jgi:hypothetical protein
MQNKATSLQNEVHALDGEVDYVGGHKQLKFEVLLTDRVICCLVATGLSHALG